jgi:hypothetical protein
VDSVEIRRGVFLLMVMVHHLEALVAQQAVLKGVYLNSPTSALVLLFQNVQIVQGALDAATVRTRQNV